jgi:hypothetical protein
VVARLLAVTAGFQAKPPGAKALTGYAVLAARLKSFPDALPLRSDFSLAVLVASFNGGWLGGLLVFVGGEAEGDGAPEEAGAHLHGQVTIVVGVPDPDVAAIFDHSGIGGGLDADGFEGADGGLDLFAALDLHGDGDGVHGVDDRNHEALADFHGLRRSIEDACQKVGEAAGDGHLHVLILAGDHVLFVEDGLELGVVQTQGGIDLAAAFDGLLVEFVGASLGGIERGLEMVADVEEQIDGAGGVGVGGDALAIALGLEVNYGCSGGKYAPVDGVAEGLPGREGVASARWWKGRSLLPVCDGSEGEDTKKIEYSRAHLHRRA